MTNKEKAREIAECNDGHINIISFESAKIMAEWKDQQIKEQKKIDIENAHKAFVELLAVQYGEDCDESMHQYIDDALKKAMGE